MEKLDAETLTAGRSQKPTSTPQSPPPPEPNSSEKRMPRGVPERRAGQTFESFDVKRSPGMADALKACRQVAAGEEWCAVLYGAYGVGKTHLAIAAMNAAECPSYFWKVPEFLRHLRDRVGGKVVDGAGAALSPEMLLDGMSQPGFLLVLDDLGAENTTDWAAEQLYLLLDRRYEERAPTIITTNAKEEALDGRIRARYQAGFVVCRGENQHGR
jgi:DNA replication protein DnaC